MFRGQQELQELGNMISTVQRIRYRHVITAINDYKLNKDLWCYMNTWNGALNCVKSTKLKKRRLSNHVPLVFTAPLHF